MKSMALAFEVFIGTALITGALLIAGSEMALLERDLRELGVLKAIGAGKKEIVAYYSGYNIMPWCNRILAWHYVFHSFISLPCDMGI